MNDLVSVAQLERIAGSEERFPVDFDWAWQTVDYSTKSNALRTLKENFNEGVDFDSSVMMNQTTTDNNNSQHGGDRKTVKYMLSVDCFQEFCMLAGTEKGKELQRRLFRAIRSKYQDLQGGYQQIILRLDRMEKALALLVERVPDQKPLQITAPENQKVLDFIENHVVYTRLDTDLVKQRSV
jgi:phage anti-repressor protein